MNNPAPASEAVDFLAEALDFLLRDRVRHGDSQSSQKASEILGRLSGLESLAGPEREDVAEYRAEDFGEPDKAITVPALTREPSGLISPPPANTSKGDPYREVGMDHAGDSK